MRQIFALSTIACSLFFATACKKTAISDATKPDNGPSHRISLTTDESEKLRAIMLQEEIKSPADFMDKIKSVKASGKVNHVQVQTLYPAGDVTPSSENVDDADWVSGLPYHLQSVPVPFDVLSQFGTGAGLRSYQAVFQEVQTFAIRHNEIMVEIPYVATVKWVAPNNFGMAALSRAPGASQVMLRPTGAHWGQMTQLTSNNFINFTPAPGMDAHGEAQEERTLVTATNGKVKIANTIDLELYKVGMELETSVTVTGASNIYNQYNMNGTVKVAVDGPYSTTITPTFTTYASIHCTDNGILLND